MTKKKQLKAGHAEWEQALEDGDLATIQKMLDLDPGWGRFREKISRRTGLMTCALNGNAEGVRALLPFSDVDDVCSCQATALMYAAHFGGVDCVRELLPWSDAKKVDKYGRTALMVAPLVGIDCVLALLPVSDTDAFNKNGHNALMTAISQGEIDCALALLGKTDAKKTSDSGETALMLAAKCSNLTLVKVLLPWSDPQAKDADGRSALSHAAEYGAFECVNFLLPVSDPAVRDLHGKNSFDWCWESECRLKENRWKALDLLSETAPPNKIEEAFERAGAKNMPRWAAKKEVEKIAEAMRGACEKSEPDIFPGEAPIETDTAGGREKRRRAKSL